MGTQYLKGSTAVVNFPEKSEHYKNNGTKLTLTVDACASCDAFPMSYLDNTGNTVIVSFHKDVIDWTKTVQRDYG